MQALPNRSCSENISNDFTAPPFCCMVYVIAEETAITRKNGTFSIRICASLCRVDPGFLLSTLVGSPGRRPTFSKSAERPEVQQQQYKWQRHQHRFGQQSECQPGNDGCVAEHGAPASAGVQIAYIPVVGEHRQHPERCAEDVLALGDPGDRLDVQGMKCEHRGDERAAPQCCGRYKKRR